MRRLADHDRRDFRSGSVFLGRHFRERASRDRRLGGALAADALLRSMRTEITAYPMVVDAKDEAAVGFYLHLRFERLGGESRRLIRVL